MVDAEERSVLVGGVKLLFSEYRHIARAYPLMLEWLC